MIHMLLDIDKTHVYFFFSTYTLSHSSQGWIIYKSHRPLLFLKFIRSTINIMMMMSAPSSSFHDVSAYSFLDYICSFFLSISICQWILACRKWKQWHQYKQLMIILTKNSIIIIVIILLIIKIQWLNDQWMLFYYGHVVKENVFLVMVTVLVKHHWVNFLVKHGGKKIMFTRKEKKKENLV